jgi:hypothetical protein
MQARPTQRLEVTTTMGSRISTTSSARARATLAESPVISPENAPRRMLLRAQYTGNKTQDHGYPRIKAMMHGRQKGELVKRIKYP